MDEMCFLRSPCRELIIDTRSAALSFESEFVPESAKGVLEPDSEE